MKNEFPPAVIALPKQTSDVITLPNGEKAYQLWYGKIETVDELLLGLELAQLKLKTAEGWDISTYRLTISSNTHKLRKLGVNV